MGDNGLGIVGVNWNVRILACKFLDAYGSGWLSDAVGCLEYVRALRDRGVNVIATSNSWGGTDRPQSLYDAIDAQREVLFIAAAGNDYADNDSSQCYPANYYLPNLLSVAATDHNDAKASFSNYGRRSVHVGAPGLDILSSLPAANLWGITGGYGLLSGTSMAAPHVSGLAALLKSQDPGRDWRTLKNLILSGGDDLSSMSGQTITGKRINAFGSMNCTNRPLFSILKYPKLFDQGVPETLSALSINCALTAGPVTVTLSTGQTINLLDNGAAPDLAAGDGIFTATWTPSGWSAVNLTFSSPAGEEVVGAVSLRITTSYLPEASMVESYSFSLEAAGGVPPYTWSIVSRSLPDGLALNSSTGVISGTPTTACAFYCPCCFASNCNFTVQVRDALGTAAVKDLSVSVSGGLVVERWNEFYDGGSDDFGTDLALDEDGNVHVTGYTHNGSDYDFITIKYSPSWNVLWTKVHDGWSDDVATGIAVDANGNVYVTGHSDNGVDYDYILIKYDPSGEVLWTRTYHTDADPELFEGLALDTGGNAYVTCSRLTVKYDPSGNVLKTITHKAGYAYAPAAVDGSGNLYVAGHDASRPDSLMTTKYDPAGNIVWEKHLEDTGYIEYARGIAVDGDGNVYVTGDASAGEYSGRSTFLTVKYDPSGNVVWARTARGGEFEGIPRAYVLDMAVDNGGNVYVTGWDYQSCSTNNEYYTIKYDTYGNLIWTKTSPGRFLWDYGSGLAVDGNGNVYVTGYSWDMENHNFDLLTVKYNDYSGYTLRVNTATLPAVIAGRPYSYTLHAGGGTPPYTWSIVSESLPAGLTLNGSTGIISGTASATGTFNFTIQVTDAGAGTATRGFALYACSLPVINGSSLPDGQTFFFYNQTLSAACVPPPYIWTITSGSLPDGLVLDISTGVISEVPSVAGEFNFLVKVTDPNFYFYDERWVSIAIYGPLSITTESLPSGNKGAPYSATVSASGSVPYYTWSIRSGALPPGLALNSSTGEISGTPTAAGNYYFTAQANDVNANIAIKALSIFIYAPLAVTTTSLNPGDICNAYSRILAAEGGYLPYTWAIISGSLPEGLTLNSSTGEISGTSTATGVFNFTAQVMDAIFNASLRSFQLAVYFGTRISGTPLNYLLLQDACNATPDGGALEILAVSLTEDLDFNQHKSVALRGGYDCNFTTNSAYTTIAGNMNNRAGTITLEKINLKGTLTINGGTAILDNIILE